ncbi:MAG: sulfatase-like hydrolase/transferase [Akkermansiaceae bacterium]
MIHVLILFTGLLVIAESVVAGSLVINEADAPADAIVSQAVAGSFTRSFENSSNNGKTTRGNTFLMPDMGNSFPGYKVTGLTLRKDEQQSFGAGDELQLWLFAWDPADDGSDGSSWTQAGTNGLQDGDPLSGTGMSGLLVDTYSLSGMTFNDESFFTFDFTANPLYLAKNKVYGFVVGCVDGGGDGGSYFQYREGSPSTYADGVQIRNQGLISGNSVYSPRDVTFFVRGVEIDEGIYATDSDGDGLSDVWEAMNFQGLAESGGGDADGDGVDNEAEETAGTDPNEADSDEDGLEDGVEIAGPTDPLDADSDDDGLLDGVESGTGVYVSGSDTGTDAMLDDSDDDGFMDGVEISRGSDPSDGGHVPGELPNIVFIMIDDLDVREIGVYGQATLKTPRVDAMAGEGMMFTDYYTASPVCHSCRSSLITGQDSRRSQDRFNSSLNLEASRVTIGEVLKEAGYTTGCVGKWGMGTSTGTGAPWKQGFDFFCGYLSQVNAHRFFPKYLWRNDQKIYFDQTLASSEGGSLYIPGAANLNGITKAWTDDFGNVCSHDVVVSEGLKFIEDNVAKPFFLYCAWTPPHAYMYPAATLVALTDADGLVYDPMDLDQTMINEVYPGAPFGGTAASPDFNNHCYASMVSAADRDTGRILDKLVELGIDDKTLVIFCSDNGEDEPTFLTAAHLKAGYEDLRGAKKDTYEGGIRAPFVAWWPGEISAGTSSDVVGTFADMLPTFAEMAGLTTPMQVTGRSILPILRGGGEADLQDRDYHYWSFREHSNGLFRRWRTVRQGDWKIVRDRDNSGGVPSYELFDLGVDPYETNDLSASESVVLGRLIPLVEGTHEVPVATYFRADDEFYSKTNLAAAGYVIDTPDGSGASNGYSLTASGVGSGFNYLPFSDGVTGEVSFDWVMQFPAGGAGSFLVSGVNSTGGSLKVRIDADDLRLEVIRNGGVVTSGALAEGDVPSGMAECVMRFNPATGVGEVEVGAVTLDFDLAASFGALRFWGYEVESSTVQTSRPRWQVGASGEGTVVLREGEGLINASYRFPSAVGESVVTQYSTDLITWYDNPPGLLDSRSINSQGEVQGVWNLPMDSLLSRQNERLFLRIKTED